MTKTSWQTGNLKIWEILLGHAYSREGCIRNIFQKTERERSPDNPQNGEFVFSCGRWFSKIIRKRLQIPRNHSETDDLKNQKMTQKLGKKFGLFKEISFIVIILDREFKLRTERRIIPRFTRFTLLNETSPRRNIRSGRRIGEKPKHLRQKQIQVY